jgi:hypothetical protein
VWHLSCIYYYVVIMFVAQLSVSQIRKVEDMERSHVSMDMYWDGQCLVKVSEVLERKTKEEAIAAVKKANWHPTVLNRWANIRVKTTNRPITEGFIPEHWL